MRCLGGGALLAAAADELNTWLAAELSCGHPCGRGMLLPILPTLATVLAVTCLSRKNRLQGVGSSAWGCGTGQLSPCRRTGNTPNIVRRGVSRSRGYCCRFLSPLLSLLCLPLACQPWPASPPSPWPSWCCCSSQAAAAPALPGSSCPSLQGHWNPRLAPQAALRGRHLQLHGLRLQSDSVRSPPHPSLPLQAAPCHLRGPGLCHRRHRFRQRGERRRRWRG
jgi:hypothetical protein